MSTQIIAYFAAYSLSMLGNGIASVLLPLLVLARTGDVLAAGIVASVTAGAGALVGMFAGVVVDRVNRRTVSIVSDVLSGAAVAALPVVDALTGLTLPWFICLAVVGAFGDAPGLTAREVLLPRLAGAEPGRPDRLDRLVGAREAISGVLVLAAPGAGGLLIAVAGVGSTTLLVTAATSFAAAACSFGVRHRAGAIAIGVAADPLRSNVLRAAMRDLLAGFRFLSYSHFLLGATFLTAVFVAASVALQTSLLPAYFTALELPSLTGVVVSSIAAGGMIGAGLYAALAARIRRRTWFVGGLLGTIVGFFGVGSFASPWLVFAAAFTVGLMGAPVSAALGVATIKATPDHMRGRILGAQNVAIMAAPALAAAPVAGLASGIGLVPAGLILAGGVAVACVVSLVAPVFKSLDDPTRAEA